MGTWTFKNNSMFVKLLLSLTAIAVITVVLITTITYKISADNSVRNSIMYNQSIQSQQQELIHKELATIRNAVNNILMTEPYLYKIINGKLSVSSLIDLSAFIAKQQQLSPYIDSIYLYYDPLKLVLSSRPEVKASSISTFADRSWLDVWNQATESRTVWVTGRENGFAAKQPAASLLQKMPLIGQVDGAIVINLKLDLLFSDYFSHNRSTQGSTMILDQDGALLFSESTEAKTLLGQLDAERMTLPSGSYIENSEQIVTYTTSNMTGWRFVDITERSALLHGMSRIKIIVWSVALTYIIAAFVTSYYLSRRLYRPLQRVISYIAGSEETDRNEDPRAAHRGDEAGFIRQSFERISRNRELLLKENHRVGELLSDNRTAIKEKYLNDLIQGSSTEPTAHESEHAAELLGLRLDFNRFTILTLELEEPYPIKGPDDTFHFHLFQYGLMEELKTKIDGELFAKDSRRIVIVLSIPPEDDDSFPYEQAEMLKQYVFTRYEISVTIAISRIHSGKAAVRTAYNDTLEALKLKIYIGKGEVLPYSIQDEWRSEEGAYYYPYILETKLLQALLQTDMDECIVVIREITRAVLEQKLGKANIQQLYVQLSGEIVKTLVQTGGELNMVFGERPPYTDALARAETVQDMEECLLAICGKIIDYHREKRSKMTDVTLQLATDYMDSHYNKNITVDTVAEYVQRSSSYLSRIFKESKGITLNDYLIQLRLKRAMEMLQQSNASIEEICREIGYANVSYFNKMFKARIGLTPGQYRHQQATDQLLAQGKGPAAN
ncbi:helix-turn-helix domain-containing protein [Paenibacillus sp. FSL R10-2734]|uniref:helix-turn-helix domain-containing protein n=1 Tax=Paenibacillus sp. FSL R10-2734 TaxID=2954691 RepID=UPI0030D8A185